MPSLLISVRFIGSRYHGLEPDGRPEWPPAPARLFQALVAGAAMGATVADEDKDALMWLERLGPPLIAASPRHKGQSLIHYVPNNDLDTKGGDPTRIGEIRTPKRFQPQIFDRETPFLYLWSFDHGQVYAERIQVIALRLYQLGRGVDMAWAVAEILDEKEASNRLTAYPGAIHRPARNGRGRGLACPISGSFQSLAGRYEKSRVRFKSIIEPSPTKKDPSRTKVAGQTFAKPPVPKFRKFSYDSPPVRLLYEMRDMAKDAGFFVWPLKKVVRLVENVRNDAAERMKKVFPAKVAEVEQVFGLRRDATEADKARRIRIIPLPSIGHQHADHGIRRLLVEIPPDCLLAADDIAWAFSEAEAIDWATGEIIDRPPNEIIDPKPFENQCLLVSAGERGMLDHYGIGDNVQDGFRIWRTVTPMVLPVARPRGRRNGSERADIEHNATAAVVQALRHAGIASRPTSIRVQREPFDTKGARAENFAPNTRFAPSRLWHVEVIFAQPVAGPLLAGDGRYLGLGLMKPVKRVEGVHAFVVINGLSHHTDSQSVTRALRRAVMALVQDRLGPRATLPTFFTGHEADGAPARRGGKSHLAFAFDAVRRRLLIIAPHLLEGREPSHAERKHLGLLGTALADLRELRAGTSGLLNLKATTIAEDNDPLFAYAKTWITQTEYCPTRYSKRATPEQAVAADVELELRRRGFPVPASIETISVSRGPRGGLSAQLRLVFSAAVKGPLLLGKTCNFGGGLFAPASSLPDLAGS